jgi:hypothetical protein
MNGLNVTDKEPWLSEPDRDSWRIKDMLCVALRDDRFGHWCGYVGVGAAHPLYGVTAGKLEKIGERLLAHGDVNASGRLVEYTGWFFGFDCAHAFDYQPYHGRHLREIGAPEGLIRAHEEMFSQERRGPFPIVYRDLNYVRANCAALAAQILAIVEDDEALAKVQKLRG